MSAYIFIASDSPLGTHAPSQDYPISINLDDRAITICDGSADDNYFLSHFSDVGAYTDKKYAVSLEWRYTDGRAERIVEYIKSILQNTDSVELWRVWSVDYYEFEDRPFIHKKTVSAKELTIEDIKAIDNAKIWNTPDKTYPNRPSFYCLTIK